MTWRRCKRRGPRPAHVESATERWLYARAFRTPIRRFCMRDVETGRLLEGHASQHQTDSGRAMRLWWRLKRRFNLKRQHA